MSAVDVASELSRILCVSFPAAPSNLESSDKTWTLEQKPTCEQKQNKQKTSDQICKVGNDKHKKRTKSMIPCGDE